MIIKLRDLSIYPNLGIKVDKFFAEIIRNKIKEKYSTYENASKDAKVHPSLFNLIGKRCTKIYNLIKILNIINLPFDRAEQHIETIWDRYFYNIKFPLELNPLFFRLVAHLIGDGCYKGNSAVWIQKNAEPVLELQDKLLGSRKSKWHYKTAEHALIMDFYVKLVCAALKIKRDDIQTDKFIKACNNLPRFYKVQVISAIVEDESRIQPISCSFRIAMKDKRIIKALAMLLDSLNYERSEISKIRNNSFDRSSNSYLFSIQIRILGAHRLYKDLKLSTNKYGKIAGLWKKHVLLYKLVKYNTGRNAINRNNNIALSNKIINFTKENKEGITYNELQKRFHISYRRASSLLFKMQKRNMIKRINKGSHPALFCV